MKFSDNLQKLRKEAKLSQEALAEKLGVTRQSVSKWESGSSYPEMDKLISMCSIFDCSMDYLLNGTEKEKKEEKTQTTVDDIVNEFVVGASKTVNMLSRMDAKGIIKFILELIIILFIILLFKIPVEILNQFGESIFNNLGGVGDVLSTLWTVFIEIAYFILAVLFFITIYKTRYLDGYEEVKVINHVNKNSSEENEDENKFSTTENDNENNLPVMENKNVIKHENNGGIISVLSSLLMVFIKFIVVCILIGFAMECMFAIVMFAFSVVLFIDGVHIFGPVIGLFGLVIFSIIICELLFNFVVNKKTNLKRLFINFVISFLLMGFGISMSIVAFSKFTYINGLPERYKPEVFTKEIDMNNDLNFECYGFETIDYIPDESLNNIKIEIAGYKDFNNYQVYVLNNHIQLHNELNTINGSEHVKEIIRNLKNKKIYNYDNTLDRNIKVYANSKNIEILKQNSENYCKQIDKEDSMIESYENEINQIREENDELSSKIYDLEYEKEELKEKNNELREKIKGILEE